jgi:hypothetical protein
MLASITPLGQRGTRSGWRLTAGSFLIAAAAAGAGLGALLGSAGGAALPASAGAGARLVVLSVAALLALALDLAAPLLSAPGPRRQVNERWRDEYRGWVYGAGYGAQLGLAVTTVVSSAATYLALAAAFLCGGAVRGAVIMGVFGAARGVQPLVTASIATPRQLLELHTRLQRWRNPVGSVVTGVLVAIMAAALLGALA